MNGGEANFVVPAELIGHPARSAMLLALLDGRALPMSMLASEAGVAASTASEHLSRLTEGGLLRVRPQGRRRYFELASPEVAHALEVLARLAPATPVRSLRDGTRAHALRLARTCYDHLAGHLGVAVMQSMLNSGILAGGDGIYRQSTASGDRLAAPGRDVDYRLTQHGRRTLDGFGLRVPPSKRRLVAYCVDWTEQRHHVGGALGAALLRRFTDLHWLDQGGKTARSLVITADGKEGFSKTFGIDTTTLLKPRAA